MGPHAARLTRLALLAICLLTLSASVRAQAGPFDFPDEEEDVPTWSDDVRAQAVDITLLGAFATLAFVSFFRKSERLKVVTLVAAVGYLGFAKSDLVSIVNVFGLVGGNLPVFRYN